MTPCIHTTAGLCPVCQADYDTDPQAWAEFGQHPAGIARWEALEREIDEERQRLADALPIDWTDVPF